MAKKSDSTSTSSTPRSPQNPSEGRMVLRVRTSERMKEIAAKLREPTSEKKPKTAASKKKSSEADALKPKKPPTAFFYFLEDFRKEFQENNPDIKSMREIGKACGDKWKTMNYELLGKNWNYQHETTDLTQVQVKEKVAYYDIATEKRAEFDQAMADYNKRKEMGEFQEYEEDSDF